MDAIELALACYRSPLAHHDRLSLTTPLPDDMDRLLGLANGSPRLLETATRQTGAKANELQDAARFCIQQWCLAREADSYRVLGVQPGAPLEKIKEHYRQLIRLFHPDRAAGRETWTEHYASRINEAWMTLSCALADPVPSVPSPPRFIALERQPSSNRLNEFTIRGFVRIPIARKVWLPGRGWPKIVIASGLLTVIVMGWNGFFGHWASVTYKDFETVNPEAVRPATTLETAAMPVRAPAPNEDALSPFLTAPDWRALEQREWPARQKLAWAEEERERLEESRRQVPGAEKVLLEKMPTDRAPLQQQSRSEQSGIDQPMARPVSKRQSLTRLPLEQARMDQAKIERERAERQRLAMYQAEQVKVERLRALAEQRRSEEQAKAESERVEKSNSQREPVGTVMDRAALTFAPMGMATPENSQLTSEEVQSLMSRYLAAYQRSDLNSTLALFGAGASGRIRKDYATLFATHQILELRLQDLQWVYRGPSASGFGRYELWLQPRDRGGQRRVEGKIRFTVKKRGGKALISAIEYDWPNR